MKEFSLGDSVKLTHRFACALMRSKHRIDWRVRVGTVKAVNSYEVFILWDGRKTPEAFPLKGVERIGSK